MEKITYTIAEAAEIIGVSKSLMYKMAKNNEIPVIKLGRRWVISKYKLIEFINK